MGEQRKKRHEIKMRWKGLFKMAETTLYNQDCIAAMQQIGAESIDLIVTDPPYNLGNFMKKRDTNLKKMRDNFFGSAGWDDMEFDEWSKSMDDFFKASARVMKKGGTERTANTSLTVTDSSSVKAMRPMHSFTQNTRMPKSIPSVIGRAARMSTQVLPIANSARIWQIP